MTLLDTHVLIWLRRGGTRLGKQARSEIRRALQSNEVAVSAITFWELQMLIRKDRIHLDCPVDTWRRVLLKEGLIEIPLDGEIAIRADLLTHLVNDPADRFIVSTALAGHRLVTADRRILDWPGNLKVVDATR